MSRNPYPRNPLGLLTVFASLCYSLLSLVYLRGNLELKGERITFLVCFVAFPSVIIALSIWLIVKHTEKLYSPRDYGDSRIFKEILMSAKQVQSKNEEKQKQTLTKAEIKNSHLNYEEIEKSVIKHVSNSRGIDFTRNVIIQRDSHRRVFDAVGTNGMTKYFCEVKLLMNESKVDVIKRRLSEITYDVQRLVAGTDYDYEIIFAIVGPMPSCPITSPSDSHITINYFNIKELTD